MCVNITFLEIKEFVLHLCHLNEDAIVMLLSSIPLKADLIIICTFRASKKILIQSRA